VIKMNNPQKITVAVPVSEIENAIFDLVRQGLANGLPQKLVDDVLVHAREEGKAVGHTGYAANLLYQVGVLSDYIHRQIDTTCGTKQYRGPTEQ